MRVFHELLEVSCVRGLWKRLFTAWLLPRLETVSAAVGIALESVQTSSAEAPRFPWPGGVGWGTPGRARRVRLGRGELRRRCEIREQGTLTGRGGRGCPSERRWAGLCSESCWTVSPPGRTWSVCDVSAVSLRTLLLYVKRPFCEQEWSAPGCWDLARGWLHLPHEWGTLVH